MPSPLQTSSAKDNLDMSKAPLGFFWSLFFNRVKKVWKQHGGLQRADAGLADDMSLGMRSTHVCTVADP